MWAGVQGCLRSDPERPELLDLRRPRSGARAGSRDASWRRISGQIPLHAKLFVSDVDCLSWFLSCLAPSGSRAKYMRYTESACRVFGSTPNGPGQ